jgi:class 3 adenylate cyclase
MMSGGAFFEKANPQLLANANGAPFGLVALVGATVSIIFCYGQILISLITPILGLAAFELNIHVQAIFMWLFGLVTVYGLARDRRAVGNAIPLAVGVIAVMIIAGTLYTVYDIRVLILGYALLVISALLNQIIMLHSLKQQVEARAAELSDLNNNLELKVKAQVGEIDRLARLKRFLTPEVADLIINEGKEDLLNSHRQQIACLFCDIRNFTPLTETLEPEEIMEILQTFHETMGRLITESGGTIGSRAGDSVMVFFNDPLPCDEPSREAAVLALRMRSAFIAARKKWERLGNKISIGFGIGSGYATLGIVGDRSRRDYTAIGKVVNLASRLCEQAGPDEILMDRRAYLESEPAVLVDTSRALSLKGIGEGIEAFPLQAIREESNLG